MKNYFRIPFNLIINGNNMIGKKVLQIAFLGNCFTDILTGAEISY